MRRRGGLRDKVLLYREGTAARSGGKAFRPEWTGRESFLKRKDWATAFSWLHAPAGEIVMST